MPIPFIIINLDKPRNLRFGYKIAFEFEQTTGKTVDEFLDSRDEKTSLKMLYLMLKKEEPDITEEKTIDLVDEYAESLSYAMIKTMQAVTTAYTGKLPEEKESPNAQTPAAKK
jgi:hypothetical protein